MREIKFRAWDSFAGKMWDDVYFDGGHIFTIGGDGENASTMPRWDDNHLMQFTGLKDKNGKEIYEGDIVGISGSSKEPFIIRSEMKFNCGCCSHVYGWEFVGSRFDFDEKEFEVFGNIYENPGLKALTIGG